MFGNTNIKELIDQGATLIDVRSPMEFDDGHVEGSINMPLNTIPAQLPNLKEAGKTIVTCCLSGGRSGQAAQFLEQNGVTAINGGPWTVVREALSKHA